MVRSLNTQARNFWKNKCQTFQQSTSVLYMRWCCCREAENSIHLCFWIDGFPSNLLDKCVYLRMCVYWMHISHRCCHAAALIRRSIHDVPAHTSSPPLDAIIVRVIALRHALNVKYWVFMEKHFTISMHVCSMFVCLFVLSHCLCVCCHLSLSLSSEYLCI